jgi:hypothetical protein
MPRKKQPSGKKSMLVRMVKTPASASTGQPSSAIFQSDMNVMS